VKLDLVAPELWNALGGVLRLDGGAFVQMLALQPGPVFAVAIVLAAGLSEAVGQSIVLFANRVKPARFVLGLIVDGLLFTGGYLFIVASAWAVCRFPGAPHLSFRDLALVFAVGYAPLVFSFLSAMPYLGGGLMRALRIWHFLAMVVGLSAVAGVDVFAAATYVWLGWLVDAIAQRSFGKPIAQLGSRILDAAAGVRVVDDAQLIVGRMESGKRAVPPATTAAAAAAAPRHPRAWLALAGLGGVLALAAIVTLALEPARQAIFGWQEHLPPVARLPIDLLWLCVIAIVVSAFMAPIETLGWWAGWFGEPIDTSGDAADERAERGVARYVVYLDGIAQSGSRYTPDIETFLDALAPELPADMRLVRGVMSYSAINKPLDDDPIFSRFWKFVESIRLRNADSLLGMFINFRNVTIVAVSADPRYGPIYNFGVADVIYRALLAHGYARKSGTPVTLIGYSGGGQMACGAAGFLKRALGAPVDVISLGGVISGNDPILELEHLYHLVGEKDGIERIGPVMFASRWPIALLSYWNRAKRLGCLTEISLGPVGHQVPGGMLDPNARLPDGRTNLRQTLDDVESILLDRFVSESEPPRKATNYARYAAQAAATAVAAPWARPPEQAADRFAPVAPWVGRLILPRRDERFGGALFEVRHAPAEHRELAGTVVRLAWSGDARVRDRLRPVTRDVNFSAEARWAATFGGLILPVRLNRWRLVDPLESLAGARPHDDVVVKLAGDVVVESSGEVATLRIAREPVQTAGPYVALLSFRGPAPGTDDGFRAVHYDSAARAFGTQECVVRMPAVATDLEGLANSTTVGIDRSPENATGWYAYGEFDGGGAFVVRALVPRTLVRLEASVRLESAHDASSYARHRAWPALVAAPGAVTCAAFGDWRLGDAGLVVHTYGGIGGRAREKAASGPFYFGHFAYGMARVVLCPLAGEPRFEIAYHQIYTQNSDGIVAGATDLSRYLGDRQWGWLGVRPVCDALLRQEGFAHALDAFALQLEAMAARYRIGDGTGGTFVGAANNCSQDSNRALFATLRALRHAAPGGGDPALLALERDLHRALQPFGAPRRDWSENEYDLGSTMDDAPVANLLSAIGSWRCILPRVAFDTIVGIFARHGAAVRVVGTNHAGGERFDVEPVVPLAL